MLTRPGAGSGCSWMMRLSACLLRAGPAGAAEVQRGRGRIVWIWLVILPVVIVSSQQLNRAWVDSPGQPYESSVRIGGLPLYAYGQHARGIVAVGAFPVGVIAIGGLPVGVLAVGGVAAGIVAVSGVSLGVFALGGLAVGWWAVGGGAVGYYAFGGLAVGGYAYAGNGVALGYQQAEGRQKERLFG